MDCDVGRSLYVNSAGIVLAVYAIILNSVDIQ